MMVTETPRQRTYRFLEMGSFGGRGAAVFEGFMIALIIANVIAVGWETIPSLYEAHRRWFNLFDAVSVGIFTVEYIARVWASAEREMVPGDTQWQRRLRYMLSPLALVDLVAILPFYLGAFVSVDLRALRVFRLLRFLKLVRYSPALSSLARVVYSERQALLAAMVIMFGIQVFAATLMYMAEHEAQPEVFSSIPASLWWALATLTTVGYGDIVPVTDLGKVIGSVVMIVGFIFYAVPVGILASGFSDEVHRREFHVPVGVIEDIPALSRLPRDVARELSARVRSISLIPGTVLTHRSDHENGIYFILSGKIVVFYHHRPITLGAGDFLGECAVVSEDGHQAATVSHDHCRLMWLESTELHILLSLYPDLVEELRTYASSRLAALAEDGHLAATDRVSMLNRLDAWFERSLRPVTSAKEKAE